MRTPAPIRAPIGTAGPDGVIVVSPAWQEWFQRLADYYETVSKLIDPGASNFGQIAPTNPSEGLLAYADGVNWDPGGLSSGAGIYFYTSGEWKPFDIGGAALFAPIAKGVTGGDDHSARHENGGADEISVAGLSGELADNQPPKTHGNSAHSAIYGSCYGNEIALQQTAMVQNTWYLISDADMADGMLSGVTHDGSGKLTCATAGKYLIVWAASLDINNNGDHIQIGIAVSGTVNAAGVNHAESVKANDHKSMSGTAILSITAGQTIEVAFRTTDANTPTVNIDHLNISIVQVGA